MKTKFSQILGFLTGFAVMGVVAVFAGATFSRVKNWSSNEILTAADLNAEFNNILTNLTPAGVDDYSASTTEMRTVTDPYPASTEDAPTSLAGELENIRYQILEIKKAMQASDVTYWYQDLPTAGVFTIAGSSVGVNDTTPDYSLDVEGTGNITGDTLIGGTLGVTGPITTSTMTASSMTVTNNFYPPSAIAGNGLALSAGVMSVGVDNSTIELNSDALRLKDGGITLAKLSSEVTNRFSPNSVQVSYGTLTWSSENGAYKTGDVTISSVDTDKSYVLFNGIKVTSAAADEGDIVGGARLTSATNVEVFASIESSSTEENVSMTVQVHFTVVEWD